MQVQNFTDSKTAAGAWFASWSERALVLYLFSLELFPTGNLDFFFSSPYMYCFWNRSLLLFPEVEFIIIERAL